VYFWKGQDTGGNDVILTKFNTQYEIVKPDTTDVSSLTLYYIDIPFQDISIDSNGNIVDEEENILSPTVVDWADVTASFNESTKILTITRSASIPIVLEIWNGTDWVSYKTWNAGTSDITVKIYHGGSFRVRRDWTSNTEASNVVEMVIGPYEKIGLGAFDDGTAGVYIQTNGQFQVGDASSGKFVRFGKFKIQGTVSGSSGSTSLSGTGTKFLSELRVGDILIINDTEYTVASIQTDTSLTLSSALVEDISNASAYLPSVFVVRADMRVAKDENEIIFEDSGIRLRDSGYTAGTLYQTLVEFIQEFFGTHSVQVKNIADTDGYNVYTYNTVKAENQYAKGEISLAGRAENGDTESSATAEALLYFYVMKPPSYGGSGEAFLGLKRVSAGSSWYSEFFLNSVNWFKIPIVVLTDTSLPSNAPDGALAIDTSGNLRFKKGGVWKTVQLA